MSERTCSIDGCQNVTSGFSYCPSCRSEYNRRYKAARREQISAYNKAWHQRNLDAKRAYALAYYYANHEARVEYDRRYKAEHADQIRERDRIKWIANADRLRAFNRRYKAANPEANRAREMKRRGIKAAAICEHGPKCVDATFLKAIYASECIYCGQPAEHADHFIPLARGGLHCVENIVPACAACNSAKSHRDPAEWMESLGVLI